MAQVRATNTTQQQNTLIVTSSINYDVNRDPAVRPAYQSPFSYDEHSAIKKVSEKTKFDRLGTHRCRTTACEKLLADKLNMLMNEMNARWSAFIECLCQNKSFNSFFFVHLRMLFGYQILQP